MTEVPTPVDRAETPVALEASADRVSVRLRPRGGPGCASAAGGRAPTPTPAVQTPPPASPPLLLAQDDAEPQDAMLPQDRPVLMDARMPVGTSGSAPGGPPRSRRSRRIAIAPAARSAVANEPCEQSQRQRRRATAAAPSGLVVITQPEGARVTINGVGWGMTPLTIGHLPPGAKRVRVTKPGYRSEERVVAKDRSGPPPRCASRCVKCRRSASTSRRLRTAKPCRGLRRPQMSAVSATVTVTSFGRSTGARVVHRAKPRRAEAPRGTPGTVGGSEIAVEPHRRPRSPAPARSRPRARSVWPRATNRANPIAGSPHSPERRSPRRRLAGGAPRQVRCPDRRPEDQTRRCDFAT